MYQCKLCYYQTDNDETDECPECGGKVDTAPSAMIITAPLDIRNSDILPDVCYRCGKSTSLRKKYRKSSIFYNFSRLKTSIAIALSTLLANPGPLLARKKKHSISLKIPVCADCYEKSNDLRPTFIDLDKGYVSYMVHPRFLQAYNLDNY